MSSDQNAGGSHNIKTDNSCFERVEHFRYFRTNLTNQNYIVVYVGMGLDLHQILYRQVLRVKDRTAFRWVVISCHQSDYYLTKRTPRQYNKVV